MDIQVKSKDEISLKFELKGVTYSYANLLRRTMMRDIPVYAIDSVMVYENSTEMIDEFMAHRLGLIPLVTPPHADSKPREVVLSLDATVSGQQYLYSKDIKSDDAVVKIAVPDIPLFVAAEGKGMRLEAKAKVGYGWQHSKFQACSCAYEQKSEDNFIFTAECFYQKKPIDVLKEGLEIMAKKTEEYIQSVEELK